MESASSMSHSVKEKKGKGKKLIEIQKIPCKQKLFFNFSIVTVVKHWDRFPGMVLESPSLQLLRKQLSIAMSKLV